MLSMSKDFNPFDNPIRLMRVRHRLDALLRKEGLRNTFEGTDLIEELIAIELDMYKAIPKANEKLSGT